MTVTNANYFIILFGNTVTFTGPGHWVYPFSLTLLPVRNTITFTPALEQFPSIISYEPRLLEEVLTEQLPPVVSSSVAQRTPASLGLHPADIVSAIVYLTVFCDETQYQFCSLPHELQKFTLPMFALACVQPAASFHQLSVIFSSHSRNNSLMCVCKIFLPLVRSPHMLVPFLALTACYPYHCPLFHCNRKSRAT